MSLEEYHIQGILDGDWDERWLIIREEMISEFLIDTIEINRSDVIGWEIEYNLENESNGMIDIIIKGPLDGY